MSTSAKASIHTVAPPPRRLEMLGPDEVRARLAEVRARRGYLLPHQGPMAAALPDLQDAYFVMYKSLTLTERHLDNFEKEFVWLCILAAAEEHIGTHHVQLFNESGATADQARAAWRLTAWAMGAKAYAFLDKHWQRYFPSVEAARSYQEGATTLIAGLGLPPATARLALIGVHTARSDHWGLAAEIEAAYAVGVPEPKIAEAMSLAMWPTGINRFLEACGVWLEVIRAGRVTPSPSFKVWAETPDQGGFHATPPKPPDQG